MARRGKRASKGRFFEVLLQSREFKIVRWTLLPGESTPSTLHKSSFAVMPRTDGTIERVTRLKGRRRSVARQRLTAGKPYFRAVPAEGLRQEVRNVGTSVIVFEKLSGP